VFSTATITKQMKKIAEDYFGLGTDPQNQYKEIIEKSTHMNLTHLNHEFIHIADFDKMKPLQLLMKEFKKYARKHNTSCIVFCNSVKSSRAVEHTLAEAGFKTASMHGDIPPRNRERNFERFKERKDGTQVLVATDLASRGLDIPFVSHIYNFDFPKTNSDYLHRAGRAGRAGREGFVVSMYREKDTPVLRAMQESHENLEPIQIAGSAFSMRNKEDFAKGGNKKPVSLGAKENDRL